MKTIFCQHILINPTHVSFRKQKAELKQILKRCFLSLLCCDIPHPQTSLLYKPLLLPCVSSCPSPCIDEGVGCGRLAGCWIRSARPRRRCRCGACWWCVRTACRPDKVRSSSASWLEARGPRWSTVWAHCPPSGCCPARRWRRGQTRSSAAYKTLSKKAMQEEMIHDKQQKNKLWKERQSVWIKGRQQVSLQENRVNDRREMAGDCRPKTVCDESFLITEDSMTATWKGKETEDAKERRRTLDGERNPPQRRRHRWHKARVLQRRGTDTMVEVLLQTATLPNHDHKDQSYIWHPPWEERAPRWLQSDAPVELGAESFQSGLKCHCC